MWKLQSSTVVSMRLRRMERAWWLWPSLQRTLEQIRPCVGVTWPFVSVMWPASVSRDLCQQQFYGDIVAGWREGESCHRQHVSPVRVPHGEQHLAKPQLRDNARPRPAPPCSTPRHQPRRARARTCPQPARGHHSPSNHLVWTAPSRCTIRLA